MGAELGSGGVCIGGGIVPPIKFRGSGSATGWSSVAVSMLPLS